jgi:hypothetical protein
VMATQEAVELTDDTESLFGSGARVHSIFRS